MFLSGMLAWGRMRVKTNPLSPVVHKARWLPVAAWTGGIFYLSHQSAPLGGSAGAGWSAIAHLSLYAGLALLFFWALARGAGGRRPAPDWVPAAIAFALAVLYGVSDEVHQAFISGRTASEGDVALDALGATLGIALALLVSELSRWAARVDRRDGQTP